MLILAQGRLTRPTTDAELAGIQAWVGPMVDEGFLQSGYVDSEKLRVWFVVSAASLSAAGRRLSDLPLIKSGAIELELTAVTAFRYR